MHYRSIFISDCHLGTKAASAESLLHFLKQHDCDTLYLVGDIIDGWRLSKRVYWTHSHSDIIQEILAKVKKNTKVIYIPGNHDEFLRKYVGTQWAGIEIKMTAIHTCVSGKKLLVTHGDEFDGITTYHKWLAVLGDQAYIVMIEINRIFNWVRRKFNLGHWSLSAFCKNKVKQAVNFIGNYETAISHECERLGYSGVVCGHIHKPAIKFFESTVYFNSGDWVETCSALMEDVSGNIDLVVFRNGHLTVLQTYHTNNTIESFNTLQ